MAVYNEGLFDCSEMTAMEGMLPAVEVLCLTTNASAWSRGDVRLYRAGQTSGYRQVSYKTRSTR